MANLYYSRHPDEDPNLIAEKARVKSISKPVWGKDYYLYYGNKEEYE
jgi:hypothetical protein